MAEIPGVVSVGLPRLLANPMRFVQAPKQIPSTPLLRDLLREFEQKYANCGKPRQPSGSRLWPIVCALHSSPYPGQQALQGRHVKMQVSRNHRLLITELCSTRDSQVRSGGNGDLVQLDDRTIYIEKKDPEISNASGIFNQVRCVLLRIVMIIARKAKRDIHIQGIC